VLSCVMNDRRCVLLQCTQAYAAPEVMQGIVSLEGDMYSFGVVVLEVHRIRPDSLHVQ
jgi:serine/threonine protein kinase